MTLRMLTRKVYIATVYTNDARVQLQERFVVAQVAIDFVQNCLEKSVNSTGIIVEATEFRMEDK